MNSLGDKNKASSSPASPWTETFGNILCGMSYTLGLPVEEVALCVSSVAANITGPLSGVGTKGGAGVAAGINLLALSEGSHRSQRLAQYLFHPLFVVQDFMRHSAHRTSKLWGDLYLSGPTTLKAWRESLDARPNEIHSRLIELQDATVKDLKAGDCLPYGWDSPMEPMNDPSGKHPEMVLRERAPGLRVLPSFLLRPGSLGELPAMMTDVPDQHAFIVDIQGRLFRDSGAEESGKTATWLRHLAQLMGGKDMPMPQMHADQGHGKLVRGRAALFSLMSLERAAEFLSEEGDAAAHLVMEESLLWKPTWMSVRALPDSLAPQVWAHYKDFLERLVNDRAARKGTIVQCNESVRRSLESLDAEIVHLLDSTDTQTRRYLRPFGSLMQKLFWALDLFGVRDAQLPAAVKATVTHALARHTSLLGEALSQVEAQRAARFAKQIQSVLKAKGPCSARALQRSIFQSKRSDIDVGLDRLLSTGQVVYLPAKREYHIPDDGGTGTVHRGQPLNNSIHG